MQLLSNLRVNKFYGESEYIAGSGIRTHRLCLAIHIDNNFDNHLQDSVELRDAHLANSILFELSFPLHPKLRRCQSVREDNMPLLIYNRSNSKYKKYTISIDTLPGINRPS